MFQKMTNFLFVSHAAFNIFFVISKSELDDFAVDEIIQKQLYLLNQILGAFINIVDNRRQLVDMRIDTFDYSPIP